MPDQRIVGEDESEAGSRIDEWLRLPDAAKLRVRGIKNSRLAVTEIRYCAATIKVREQRQSG